MKKIKKGLWCGLKQLTFKVKELLLKLEKLEFEKEKAQEELNQLNLQ